MILDPFHQLHPPHRLASGRDQERKTLKAVDEESSSVALCRLSALMFDFTTCLLTADSQSCQVSDCCFIKRQWRLRPSFVTAQISALVGVGHLINYFHSY